MTATPVVWHYGLMVERWAAFLTDAAELPFFRQAIARFGQPVLDVACGTGRLLVPLLREGVEIDGCDVSGDMLKYCQSKAAQAGLHTHLYEQPMHAFTLPRKYRTIYICGSFGLAGGHDQDLATLQRCYAHLEDNGALILNIQAEYTSAEAWNVWLPEARAALPQPWPDNGRRQIAAHGSEHIARFRLMELDPLTQRYTRQVRLEKWRSGALLAAEEYSLSGNMYLKSEVQLMLSVAGFRAITVQGDYTADAATADHEELVFTAIR